MVSDSGNMEEDNGALIIAIVTCEFSFVSSERTLEFARLKSNRSSDSIKYYSRGSWSCRRGPTALAQIGLCCGLQSLPPAVAGGKLIRRAISLLVLHPYRPPATAVLTGSKLDQ